ncbi:methylenetetrahydrofolate--tRNA-(uracil(54)-C(5))-methyltransferase (FADH(2)-oxidizing) TrmFO [Candidatus Fermentibacteria bacterium]|nr:methylenetetrahydrofolate--tRNA-(uracil(54)-C(5))-methyltransferase (FADH(2)-oxidizing) TrmFO [Candidatus Fermentibacteria bacterium]
MDPVVVVGAGLAGSEASWQLAEAGIPVKLYEMRPGRTTPAHRSPLAAELVCSNSLRSDHPGNAVGLLKEELRRADSLLMRLADRYRVPAGTALAVDRAKFSGGVQRELCDHPLIDLRREEVCAPPEKRMAIIATGPLTSDCIAGSIKDLTGSEHLYFYDAIAPIVENDSIDTSVAFAQSRYDKGEGADYLNCPLDEETYHRVVEELFKAEKVPARDFEEELHFAGCMPIEAIAASGRLSLAHGPWKPVGLTDPRTGKRPFAVVQLRRENKEGTAWNLVGCQTKLTYPEQRRVLRMIPGLESARFLRLGSVHRNTFIDAPSLLDERLRLTRRPNLVFAGQLTGVEGYVESVACGLVAAILTASRILGNDVPPPPRTTALGSLLTHVAQSGTKPYQPSNINFGLFPAIEGRMPRKKRRQAMAERALRDIETWLRKVRAALR